MLPRRPQTAKRPTLERNTGAQQGAPSAISPRIRVGNARTYVHDPASGHQQTTTATTTQEVATQAAAPKTSAASAVGAARTCEGNSDATELNLDLSHLERNPKRHNGDTRSAKSTFATFVGGRPEVSSSGQLIANTATTNRKSPTTAGRAASAKKIRPTVRHTARQRNLMGQCAFNTCPWKTDPSETRRAEKSRKSYKTTHLPDSYHHHQAPSSPSHHGNNEGEFITVEEEDGKPRDDDIGCERKMVASAAGKIPQPPPSSKKRPQTAAATGNKVLDQPLARTNSKLGDEQVEAVRRFVLATEVKGEKATPEDAAVVCALTPMELRWARQRIKSQGKWGEFATQDAILAKDFEARAREEKRLKQKSLMDAQMADFESRQRILREKKLNQVADERVMMEKDISELKRMVEEKKQKKKELLKKNQSIVLEQYMAIQERKEAEADYRRKAKLDLDLKIAEDTKVQREQVQALRDKMTKQRVEAQEDHGRATELKQQRRKEEEDRDKKLADEYHSAMEKQHAKHVALLEDHRQKTLKNAAQAALTTRPHLSSEQQQDQVSTPSSPTDKFRPPPGASVAQVNHWHEQRSLKQFDELLKKEQDNAVKREEKHAAKRRAYQVGLERQLEEKRRLRRELREQTKAEERVLIKKDREEAQEEFLERYKAKQQKRATLSKDLNDQLVLSLRTNLQREYLDA